MAEPKNPMTKYTKALATEICDRIAAGESVIHITKDKHMPSEPTVYAWINKHDDMFKDYMSARAMQQHGAFERMKEIAHDPDIPSDHKRIMIDVEKFRIVKLAPKWYGDKMQLSGDSDNPIAITTVTRTIIDPKD